MTRGSARSQRRTEFRVMLLCFLVIVFDGYDLIVYGATLPELLQYQDWGLTPATAGAIGGYALVGMLAGALIAGTVTDLIGRRKVMLIGVSWFSLAMAGCALAPDVTTFGLLRFLAGLGLGGVLPTAIALTAEYSRADRRSLNNAIMFSGYSVGGVLAAVLALNLMPVHGFRLLYWIGAAPLLLVPVLLRWMPESLAFLVARGRSEEAARTAERLGVAVPEDKAGGTAAGRSSLATLFSRRYLPATLLFALTSFLGLLLVYGLNTWLPQIMKSAGYPLSSSLLFLVVLNAGAIVGTILIAPLGDRIGMKPVTLGAFLAAAISIYLLSSPGPGPVMYTLVAIAGFGTIGTQIIVNGYVAMHFPAGVRATALGWTLGIGRLGAIIGPVFGGILMASGADAAWNFYASAIPAALGAAIVLLLPSRADHHEPEPSVAQRAVPSTTEP